MDEAADNENWMMRRRSGSPKKRPKEFKEYSEETSKMSVSLSLVEKKNNFSVACSSEGIFIE